MTFPDQTAKEHMLEGEGWAFCVENTKIYKTYEDDPANRWVKEVIAKEQE